MGKINVPPGIYRTLERWSGESHGPGTQSTEGGAKGPSRMRRVGSVSQGQHLNWTFSCQIGYLMPKGLGSEGAGGGVAGKGHVGQMASNTVLKKLIEN